MYDLKTAAQAGGRPTGNGFKSGGLFGGGGLRRPSDVSPSTWPIPPGRRSLEQILKDLDEALLVDQLIGPGQGNVLAGNVYDLLKDQLISLGDCAEWMFGMLHVPAIAVDYVSVVSKE